MNSYTPTTLFTKLEFSYVTAFGGTAFSMGNPVHRKSHDTQSYKLDLLKQIFRVWEYSFADVTGHKFYFVAPIIPSRPSDLHTILHVCCIIKSWIYNAIFQVS